MDTPKERVAQFGVSQAYLRQALGMPEGTVIISAVMNEKDELWLKVAHPDLPMVDFFNPPTVRPVLEPAKWNWNVG